MKKDFGSEKKNIRITKIEKNWKAYDCGKTANIKNYIENSDAFIATDSEDLPSIQILLLFLISVSLL